MGCGCLIDSRTEMWSVVSLAHCSHPYDCAYTCDASVYLSYLQYVSAVVQIADYRGYASRYVSLHSVDFGPPIPSFALLADSHMHQHYGTGKQHM